MAAKRSSAITFIELHEFEPPQQAARLGKWKAVRNDIKKPTEIHNLETDPAEASDLAASHPEIVKRAEEIFAQAHHPHPDWPMDHLTEKHHQQREAAWEIKRERDKAQWMPDNAKLN